MPLLIPKPGRASAAFLIAKERKVLPLAIGTAEIREKLAAELRAKSVFAAYSTSEVFLEEIKQVVNSITGDARAEGDERVSGMSMAEGRATLRETLEALGYTPEAGFPGDEGKVPPAVKGTLQDLSSRRRLDLILETQLALMQGRGERDGGQDALDFFPAWELVRFESREVPRDWRERFQEAGGTVLLDEAGRERLVAHKNDPVWDALGDSALFDDALDVNHPPFAFGSGMGWRSISKVAFEAMGGMIIEVEAKAVKTQLPKNITSNPSPSLMGKMKRVFAKVKKRKKGRVSVADLIARDVAKRDAALVKKYGLEVER